MNYKELIKKCENKEVLYQAVKAFLALNELVEYVEIHTDDVSVRRYSRKPGSKVRLRVKGLDVCFDYVSIEVLVELSEHLESWHNNPSAFEERIITKMYHSRNWNQVIEIEVDCIGDIFVYTKDGFSYLKRDCFYTYKEAVEYGIESKIRLLQEEKAKEQERFERNIGKIDTQITETLEAKERMLANSQ